MAKPDTSLEMWRCVHILVYWRNCVYIYLGFHHWMLFASYQCYCLVWRRFGIEYNIISREFSARSTGAFIVKYCHAIDEFLENCFNAKNLKFAQYLLKVGYCTILYFQYPIILVITWFIQALQSFKFDFSKIYQKWHMGFWLYSTELLVHIRRKCPELVNNWILHQNNTPAHKAHCVAEFPEEHNVEVMKHPSLQYRPCPIWLMVVSCPEES